MNNSGKRIKISLFAMIAGSLVVTGAQAGNPSSHGPVPFSEFDKDDSGFVSEDEFNATRGARMAAKAAEGKQLRGAATAPAFADIDSDGDGLLNPEELSTAQNAHMAQMGKGMGKGKGHGTGNGMGKGMGNGMGKGMGQGKGQGCCMGNMPGYSDFDLDGNGAIVESEFNEARAQRMSKMAAAGHKMKNAANAPGFSGIDTNNDGEISEQEFATHQAEHRKQMHKGKTPSS